MSTLSTVQFGLLWCLNALHLSQASVINIEKTLMMTTEHQLSTSFMGVSVMFKFNILAFRFKMLKVHNDLFQSNRIFNCRVKSMCHRHLVMVGCMNRSAIAGKGRNCLYACSILNSANTI